MNLWTEYEGTTIDGAFPLKKLVLPQGRSAFFSTANGNGEPILIRLVACHFDEEEILARWRAVQALNHPNFLRLERYGQLEMDDTRVVYVAFERTDANLAQVLHQGCLTVPDARQLAASLASALGMLHSNGFVHEHVEPESIFAVGEAVKLRIDCIREAPEGAEGLHAKKRDVRDLATVALQALTQERTLEADAANRRALPAPFNELVPKAIAGEWGLPEIATVLQRHDSPRGKAPASAAAPAASARSAAPSTAAPASSPARPKAANSSEDDFTPAALRHQVLPGAWRDDSAEKRKWIAAAALAASMFLLLWIGWSVYRHRAADAEAHSAAPGIAQRSVSLPEQAHSQHAAAEAQSSVPARKIWRVVAYTYDRQGQAQKRAAELARRYPDLHPSVFSPSGRAPYLVTIGGSMERNQAYALAHRSRAMGLPRDTYAQNYKSSAR